MVNPTRIRPAHSVPNNPINRDVAYLPIIGNGKLNSQYYGKQNSYGNGKPNSHQDGKQNSHFRETPV